MSVRIIEVTNNNSNNNSDNKLDNFTNEITVLETYLKGVEASPDQKTPEWYELRKTTIGGSEIATILGLNPYSKIKDLIGNKLGLNTFSGNTATRWGCLFEDVTEKWTEIALNMTDTIRAVGSVKGRIEGQRYSPDGLGVVKLLNHEGTSTYYIILFEFKAPLGTLPNGKIPKHYMPQIQTGLTSIKICDYAIFTNNCYRKCSLDDVAFNGTYDKKFHAGDYKKRKFGLEREMPYGAGVICFYHTKESRKKFNDDIHEMHVLSRAKLLKSTPETQHQIQYEISEIVSKFNENYEEEEDATILNTTSVNNLIDFGKSDKHTMNRILKLYEQKRVFVKYYPIIPNYSMINKMPFVRTHGLTINNDTACPHTEIMKNIDDFKKSSIETGMIPIGYLPWKLMRSDIIAESPDKKWKRKIKGPVKETLQLLNKFISSPNPLSMYHAHFNLEENIELELDDMTNVFNS